MMIDFAFLDVRTSLGFFIKYYVLAL